MKYYNRYTDATANEQLEHGLEVSIPVTLYEEHAAAVQQVAQEFLNVNLPLGVVIDILEYNPEYAKEAYDETLGDTDARDRLKDAVAEYALGQGVSWPVGASDPEYTKEFFERFDEAVRERAWR